MITIYCGKSAAGKDYSFRKHLREHPDAVPVVSYTTRPMRDGEKNGVDYHFLSNEEFDAMERNGGFLESRAYHTLAGGKPAVWRYASPKLRDDQVRSVDYATVLDLNGCKSYIHQYGRENIDIVYLYTDDGTREQRAEQRGSFDRTEWERRKTDDDMKFSEDRLLEVEALLGHPLKRVRN